MHNHTNTMIPKEQLEAMFQEMQENGIDTNSNLLWGYFFFDPDSNRLATLASRLKDQGYTCVEIHPVEQVDKATPRFVLHVEKAEKHTVESLYGRNLEFYALADKFGVESYDGMDVGQPE